MAGIYIHIPFCKKICYYCDFYKKRDTGSHGDFIKALKKEILLRKDYPGQELIETVYFGGGTPSVLLPEEVQILLDALYSTFTFVDHPEITFECNPEDLNPEYLKALKLIGINRLSIGCQSFDDRDLLLMNRRHNAGKSIDSVIMAHEAGFNNISIDLIYGFPGMTTEGWEKNLETALSLPIQHLSAYILTIEGKTVFNKWLKNGKIHLPDDKEIIKQYHILTEKAGNAGMIHYEISNFGKKNYFSRHNQIYWQQKKYIGLGPSAHSYDLYSRQWNIADTREYILKINREEVPCEKEIINEDMRFDEYVLTSMRTMWGIDLSWMKDHFITRKIDDLVNTLERWEKTGYVRKRADHYFLTDKGILLSDKILADCMIV